jgi:hypothetical protein
MSRPIAALRIRKRRRLRLLVAPEGYSHFVDTSGWSAEAYREWVLQGFRAFIVEGA